MKWFKNPYFAMCLAPLVHLVARTSYTAELLGWGDRPTIEMGYLHALVFEIMFVGLIIIYAINQQNKPIE